MAKIGTINLSGASGAVYAFDIHAATTNWNENVPCIYYVSKRTVGADGGGTHTHIYVGETGDIKGRFANHHRQQCFESRKYNCISIHRESNATRRQQIETDLIRGLDPPCNRE
jgi:hypothetical protein